MTKEVLTLALEALETAWYHVGTFQPTEKAIDLYDEARAAIKEALAQPEQTPYITMPPLTPMWTIPLQRTWVGLTELEKAEITSLKWWDWEDTFDIEGFIRAIEAKLKEKNT